MQIVFSLLLAVAVGAVVWLVATRRQTASSQVDPVQLQDLISDAVNQAHTQAALRAGQELRGVAVQLSEVNREQLGAQSSLAEQSLASRQELIERDLIARQELLDSKLNEVQSGVRTDLDRLSELVRQLGDATSQRFGEVDSSLRVHTEVTQALSSTANSLREALANSNSRGQWGERMAEDVLRRAGMTEGINYVKRTAVQGEGSGIPDFTFVLPKGQVVFMDVKFPMAAYLKYLDATTDAERSTYRAAFL
ncbi:MAG TPA: DNA recombination protein RmuC, partial [Ilumatobacteraceae bacterium]|nr:DNA recombination protein RmuC [Ilumatobacteraceae bacterium]